jgi:retron-type reverse transcriptase
VENLLLAWNEFVRGKRKKQDVQEFQLRLMDNLLALHTDLRNQTYRHGPYHAFKINDPKPRAIHKASVRDRLVHHALHRLLYPFFDRTFISDSFSCRVGKGTHKALNQFRSYAYKVSKNHTRTCWVLKCDIKKFFASINHAKLKTILATRIEDNRILALLSNVIDSFEKGLPLGNLTSQILVNIYMNEFDRYMKHNMKARYYIRYADDFVIFSDEREVLTALIPQIQQFLSDSLCLTLHPNKVSITTLVSGVDFLGWVHFPTHRVLRTNTKRRMLRNCAGREDDAVVRSYRGLLKWGNGYTLSQKLLYS